MLDVFTSHSPSKSDLGAQILRVRKRLASIHINDHLVGTDTLPTHDEAVRMNRSLTEILDSIKALPDSDTDPFLNSELKSLRAEGQGAVTGMKRIDNLAVMHMAIISCDAALSDLLEHIDSYPAMPIGVLASNFVPSPNLPAKDQLSSRLEFTDSALQLVNDALKPVAEDSRAVAEQKRVTQTWEELREMANDRIAGRRSRPSSVISSGNMSGRSSRTSLVASTAPRISQKHATYSNLSAASSRDGLIAPHRPPRRIVSSTEQRPASVSRVSTRSASGPIIFNNIGSTFASRQRTTSLTPSTPTKRPSGAPIPRARTNSKRSASPSVSELSSYSHSNHGRSSTSTSTWSRAPRLSFTTPQKKTPPRKAYVANPRNKLDVAVGDVVNNLPVGINIEGVSGSWKDQSGKYWIGDQDPKLCFCRILRSQTVMVRVGGGWTELSKCVLIHLF